ncbi:hypothetical protein HDU98_000115, partial [Podochytrium sp. JEL0797]
MKTNAAPLYTTPANRTAATTLAAEPGKRSMDSVNRHGDQPPCAISIGLTVHGVRRIDREFDSLYDIDCNHETLVNTKIDPFAPFDANDLVGHDRIAGPFVESQTLRELTIPPPRNPRGSSLSNGGMENPLLGCGPKAEAAGREILRLYSDTQDLEKKIEHNDLHIVFHAALGIVGEAKFHNKNSRDKEASKAFTNLAETLKPFMKYKSTPHVSYCIRCLSDMFANPDCCKLLGITESTDFSQYDGIFQDTWNRLCDISEAPRSKFSLRFLRVDMVKFRSLLECVEPSSNWELPVFRESLKRKMEAGSQKRKIIQESNTVSMTEPPSLKRKLVQESNEVAVDLRRSEGPRSETGHNMAEHEAEAILNDAEDEVAKEILEDYQSAKTNTAIAVILATEDRASSSQTQPAPSNKTPPKSGDHPDNRAFGARRVGRSVGGGASGESDLEEENSTPKTIHKSAAVSMEESQSSDMEDEPLAKSTVTKIRKRPPPTQSMSNERQCQSSDEEESLSKSGGQKRGKSIPIKTRKKLHSTQTTVEVEVIVISDDDDDGELEEYLSKDPKILNRWWETAKESGSGDGKLVQGLIRKLVEIEKMTYLNQVAQAPLKSPRNRKSMGADVFKRLRPEIKHTLREIGVLNEGGPTSAQMTIAMSNDHANNVYRSFTKALWDTIPTADKHQDRMHEVDTTGFALHDVEHVLMDGVTDVLSRTFKGILEGLFHEIEDEYVLLFRRIRRVE